MIPLPLQHIIKSRKCIPIIGAGFSLNAKLNEGSMPTWNELTKKLAGKLEIEETDSLLVSQKFQDEFGRIVLIETIEDLLYKDKVKPSYVHYEFVKIPYFDIICTTNYDNLLEDACKSEGKIVKTMVEPRQISSYGDSSELKILKIHGDLDHAEELIITQNNYSQYSEQKKVFETFLSSLLITKIPLFTGFSLKDPNFLQIWKKVNSMMGKLARLGYVVVFDPGEEEIKSYEDMGITPIAFTTENQTKSECLLELFRNIAAYDIRKQDMNITISSNKTVLFRNQILGIRVNVGNAPNEIISVYVKNENDEVIYKTDTHSMKIITNGLYETELVLNDDKWKEGEDYRVYAELNGYVTIDSFTLSTPEQIIVQTNKSVYLYGDDIILTAIVPHAYNNSEIKYKILNKSKNIIENGIIPVNNENTGIFQTVIEIEGTEWKHKGQELTIVIEYESTIAKTTIFMSDFGALIEFDQKVYSWTDKVRITIISPDFNPNPDEIGIIGNHENGLVTIETSLGKIEKYKLTGMDNDIFTGEVVLSGFIGKEIDSKILRKYPFGITGGIGPNDGLIGCLQEDTISVSLRLLDQDPIVASAKIKWNVGEISWLKPDYCIGDYGTIRVIDPDMNLFPDEIDVFDIHIYSDSDKQGIDISVYETNTATGIFEGTVCFNKDMSSDNGLLKVKEWDNVYAEYIDETLPNTHTVKSKMIVSSTAKILTRGEKLLSPLKRFTIEKISVNENKMNKIFNKNEIKLELSNNQNNIQPYVVFSQIKDLEGVPIDLKLRKKGKLGIKNQEINFNIPSGNYKMTIFIWESEENPSPLCPPKTLNLSHK